MSYETLLQAAFDWSFKRSNRTRRPAQAEYALSHRLFLQFESLNRVEAGGGVPDAYFRLHEGPEVDRLVEALMGQLVGGLREARSVLTGVGCLATDRDDALRAMRRMSEELRLLLLQVVGRIPTQTTWVISAREAAIANLADLIQNTSLAGETVGEGIVRRHFENIWNDEELRRAEEDFAPDWDKE